MFTRWWPRRHCDLHPVQANVQRLTIDAVRWVTPHTAYTALPRALRRILNAPWVNGMFQTTRKISVTETVLPPNWAETAIRYGPGVRRVVATLRSPAGPKGNSFTTFPIVVSASLATTGTRSDGSARIVTESDA